MARQSAFKNTGYVFAILSITLFLWSCDNSSNDSNNDPPVESFTPVILNDAGDAPFLITIPYYEMLLAHPDETVPLHFELSQPVKRITVIFISINDGQELDGWVTWPNSETVNVDFRVGCGQPTATVYPKLAFDNADYSRKVTYYFDPDVSTNNYTLRYEMDSDVIEEGIDTDIPIETIEFVQTALPDDKPDYMIELTGVTQVDTEIQFDYSITNLGARPGEPETIEFWPNLNTPPSVGEDRDPGVDFSWSWCLRPGDTRSHVYSIDATEIGGSAYAVVDNKQHIEELDETNNVSTPLSW